MNIARFGFAAIFLAFLALPGVLTTVKVVTGHEQTSSPAENRILDTFSGVPAKLERSSLGIEVLPDLIDTAFEDQLVGRPAATQTLNSALVYGFRHSTAEEVDIGPDAYWFRTGSPSFELLSCASPGGVDRQALDQMIDAIVGFDQRMQERGVETFVLIVPNKAAVYPEALPAYLSERCADGGATARTASERLNAAGV